MALSAEKKFEALGRIMHLAMGFQRSRVVLTAYELGLFTAIDRGNVTSAEAASDLGTDPRATDRLLNALVSLKLVEKTGGWYSNTPETSALLVAGKPDYLAGLLHGVHLWDSWSTLTQAVKKGGAVAGRPVNDRGDDWLTAFIAAMHWRATATAEAIASMVGVRPHERVLDVGGGSGAYAMAFCRQADGVTATVFDLPNVTPITQGYLSRAGMDRVVETVDGDYEADDLPGGYDLVWLSAIVHSNSPEMNENLIAKAAAALNPRGRVAIQDFVMDPDRTSPEFGALFALNMLVATDSGDTYTESEIAAWMQKAGLAHVTRHDTPFGTAIVIGEKA